MALDQISEEIAHFVGMFHLEIEAAKMRLDYLAFRTEMDGPELGPLKEDRFATRDEMALRDLRTRTDNPDSTPPSATPAAPKMAFVPWQGAESAAAPAQQPDLATDSPAPMAAGSLSLGGQMVEILPNSIVLAIAQTAFLTDDDLLIFDGSAGFTDPALYLTLLQDLAELAQSLSLIAPWAWSPANGAIMDAAQQMAEAMTAAETPEAEGLSAMILRGDVAEGSFVNGVRVDDVPAIKDLLPAFLKLKAEEAEAEAEATLVKSDGVTDHDPGPFAVDPGHHVVTGGNRVINETVLKSVWVDAPVIAVAQDVLRLDVISQVNMRIASSDLPGPAQAAPSHALNIAQLEQTSALVAQSDAGKSGDGPAEGLPSIWNVTRLDGDLMLMNWVQQHIFATDYDRVEVQFTGAATYIGTGENLVFNETLILNLGFHYDLILIGGNMLTLNQITQVNVLLDQDRITGDVPDGATLHAGDNLQVNTAAIMTTGTDSMAEKTDAFTQALSELAGGAKTIPAALAQDALFAGNDALNVLYISGDLIQTNVIEQTNYLGDSDQIHFIKDMFATAEGADVTVTSGSNAQINAASIVAQGLDSTVMAGGEAYSDALIYQAELIDDCAPPAGVQMDKLAPEAVAFLADDMIGPAPADDCGPAVQVDDCPGTVDVMQTMLA
jgi:hypothetical protein